MELHDMELQDVKLKRASDTMTEFIEMFSGPSDLIQKDYGNGDLVTMTQVHILCAVDENPGITTTELSVLKRRKKSTISQVLAVLTQKGYLDRVTDEHDAKKIRLYVTEKGHELCMLHVKYDVASMRKTQEKLKRVCTEEELDCFYKVMQLYIDVKKES